MSDLESKQYINYITIIIIAIFLLEIISKQVNFNDDYHKLINNFLFAIGSLLLLFGWKSRIFILLNIFGFLKFNIGLLINNWIKPNWISGELCFNLEIIKLGMTVITFLIIIAGFQNKLKLGTWKASIELDKSKIIIYYTLITFILQFAIRLI